jgi:hypothetical protein
MLLVILGAGASFDSSPSMPLGREPAPPHPNRPPLAKQLFSNRRYFGEVLQKYPHSRAIVPRLRHLREGDSVEGLLQELMAESANSHDRAQQIASIRYYLQEILSVCPMQWRNESQGVLNHLTLLDDIKNYNTKDEPVCFVTFNYDTLLEWAFAEAGFPIQSLEDYVSRRFALVKLHGSVNWGRVVSTPLPGKILDNPSLMATELITRYGTHNITKIYVMADGTPPISQEDRGISPALAIPVEEKVAFECPEDHLDKLKSFLPEVTKILTIGWRAAEKPFLDLLRQGVRSKRIQTLIVNGNADECIAADRNLTQTGVSGQYQIHPEGFTDFILSRKGKTFLKS